MSALDPENLPEQTVEELDDGMKVITFYSLNDEGKIVKTIRKIRMVLTQQKANHVVAERKRWKKFGDAAGMKGFDDNITALGEEIFLKLSNKQNYDPNMAQKQDLTVDEKVKKMTTSKITCRTCKGDHFTHQCPYKNTLAPLSESIDKIKGSPSNSSLDEAKDTASTTSAPGKSKYVPPSLRNKGSGGGTEGGRESTGGRREEDANTIRVTSLSEDTTEEDLRRLFQKFGHITRMFLAREYDTKKCKGFAFVSFSSRNEAERAIEVMDGYGFDNLILRVGWSSSNK